MKGLPTPKVSSPLPFLLLSGFCYPYPTFFVSLTVVSTASLLMLMLSSSEVPPRGAVAAAIIVTTAEASRRGTWRGEVAGWRSLARAAAEGALAVIGLEGATRRGRRVASPEGALAVATLRHRGACAALACAAEGA